MKFHIRNTAYPQILLKRVLKTSNYFTGTIVLFLNLITRLSHLLNIYLKIITPERLKYLQDLGS